jgi:hypothetical protein
MVPASVELEHRFRDHPRLHSDQIYAVRLRGELCVYVTIKVVPGNRNKALIARRSGHVY